MEGDSGEWEPIWPVWLVLNLLTAACEPFSSVPTLSARKDTAPLGGGWESGKDGELLVPVGDQLLLFPRGNIPD